jgi:hypothetical protein
VEALDLARQVQSQEWEALTRYGLARLAGERGQVEEARQQGQESARLFEALGHYQTAEVRQWLMQLLNERKRLSRQAAKVSRTGLNGHGGQNPQGS